MKKSTEIINGRECKVKQSMYCINESPILVSDFMSGKMEGIPSISTSCGLNPLCLLRMKNGNAICSQCFAANNLAFKKNLKENCEQNYHLFNEIHFTEDMIPQFKKFVEIVRHESYGDTASVVHADNQLKISISNPHVRFADWSKNPQFMAKAIAENGDAENCVHVHSSVFINKRDDTTWKKYPHIDVVFTVYTQEYVDAHPEIEINCGNKKCDECRICYNAPKRHGNGKPIFVNELTKADQMKLKKRGM